MYGIHTRSIDDKARVVIPPALKNELGNEFYITLGFDGNAEIRSSEAFESYRNTLESKSHFNRDVRTVTRIILGNAAQVSLDKQNRISLPKNLIEKLNIQKDIVFVGTGTVIELWAKEKFDEFEASVSTEDLAKLAQEISGI
ncbi:division/cell wall cluster transcriptional repressor MraZ [Mycoplasma corogypsi]|uniref:division/cell wall cluster transcriptional repressor MraZ n=1 Tax=Mycoplasma corogypsi TaxID=2106 RepID=UPI003872E01A